MALQEVDNLRAQLSAAMASTAAPHTARSGTPPIVSPGWRGGCFSNLSPLAASLQEGKPSPSFSTWLSSLSQV